MSLHRQDTRLISKLFFRLLPLQILLAVIGSLNGIVSGLFGSNFIGQETMSAIGLYNPINCFFVALSMMFTGGSQILCGKYMGKNQLERVRSIFSAVLCVAAVVSAAGIILLVLGAATGLTRVFTGEQAVLDHLNPYILGMAVGIFPMMTGNQLAACLSLENQVRRTTIASVLFVIANIVFNGLFVAVLKMGAFGLALSSSLGYWVFLAALMQYYITGKSQLRPSLKSFRFRDIQDSVIVGYPSALGQGYQMLRGLIVNGLILQFVGSVGLSSFAASNSVLGVFWSLHAGILSVYRMLMSISIGEEDRKSLVDVTKTAFLKAGLLLVGIAVLIILCAVPFTRLFYRDPADPVYQMTVMGFRIIPLCMPMSLICSHTICYAQAAGKQLLVHVLSILDGFGCVAGFSAILVPSAGMNGVYIANVLNGMVCIFAVVAYSWIRHRKFPRNIEEMMVIPEDFGAAAEERIDIAVRKMDEVVTVSRQVTEFCRQRGVDERRTCFAGLFMEEMAGNVVDHGFHKDKKSHTVDIRVVHKDDKVILRIKDDCVPFDPRERSELTDPKDPVKNLGIRMVYKCAKNIDYQYMMGLNVLTITL